MGIKITCPNGHKLNVKSFLAGKRGVCPHCGEKFDIPPQKGEAPAVGSVSSANSAQSTASGGELASTATASEEHPIPAVLPSVQPVSRAPIPSTVARPVAESVAPVKPVSPASLPTPVAPVHVPGSLQPSMPVAPVLPAAPVQSVPDPLSEAGEACWYVRPPSGGQYGPAKAHIMSQWIKEGRVTPDSLVWREGWPDWQLASGTFPNLPGGAAPLGPGSPMVPHAGAPVQPAGTQLAGTFGDGFPVLSSDPSAAASPRQSAGYRRKDNTSARVLALAMLLIVLIGLTGLLVWVLNVQ